MADVYQGAHVKINFSPLVAKMRQVEKGVYRSVTDSGVKTAIYQAIMQAGIVRGPDEPVTGATDDTIYQLMHNTVVEPRICTKGTYIRQSGGRVDDTGIYVDPIDLYKGRNFHYGKYAVQSDASDYNQKFKAVLRSDIGRQTIGDEIIEIIKREAKLT